MAEGDKSTPIVEELFGKDKPRDWAQERGADRIADAADLLDGSVCPPLHRMHEARLVRNAGRMVVGTTMSPPPGTHLPAQYLSDDSAMIFTAGAERRGGFSNRGTVIAVACAVALGTTAAATHLLSPDYRPGAAALRLPAGDHAADVTAALPAQGAATQIMAISKASVAADQVTPTAAPAVVNPRQQATSGLMRVAQRDASGLQASNVFGQAGKPIRLTISLGGANSEEYSFLMFRGMPAKVTLSAGFRLKESWAVSLRDLENLTIETPEDFQGSFPLEILLIKGRDTPVESKVVTVEIVPQDIKLPPATALVQPTPTPQVLTAAPRTVDPPAELRPVRPAPKPAARSSLSSSISPAQEQAMMDRADFLMQNKDISAARLLYEHLAKNGSGKAALAMGKTFDPAYLRTIEAAGLKPDLEKARNWYRQAAELGDPEAAKRLSTLASR